MAGEKAYENLWTEKTQEAFNDVFKGATKMSDSWDATGMAAAASQTEAVPTKPSTIDRLIEAQKAFNDHLLEDNKRLKSEIAELRTAIRQP